MRRIMWASALGMIAYVVMGIWTHQILDNVMIGLIVISISALIPAGFGKKRSVDEGKQKTGS
jgi:hypothetical protein